MCVCDTWLPVCVWWPPPRFEHSALLREHPAPPYEHHALSWARFGPHACCHNTQSTRPHTPPHATHCHKTPSPYTAPCILIHPTCREGSQGRPATPTIGTAMVVGTGAGNTGAASDSSQSQASSVHSYEVRLVIEYCDKGCLRDALDDGVFLTPQGLNYKAVLDTAFDIAKAMLHLHTMNVLHSDLKARNVMLATGGTDGRGCVAKVADFGLSLKMDHMETHISAVYQGTMTHMAPEVRA